MTKWDALRNKAYKIPASSGEEPLPLSEQARSRHLSIQDIDALKELIAEYPDRLEKLIRQPFEVEHGEDGDVTTMRMPPFMRNSNAYPLTLSTWQYDLLMDWVKSVPTRGRPLRAAGPKLSPEADKRRRRVLARLGSGKHR
jgi:hypothetical protein